MNNIAEMDRLASGMEQLSLHRQVQILDQCDSTNRVARQLLQSGSRPGLLVAAESQSAGRGRQGRVWQSESGANLLFSLVLAPAVPLERMARCVLIWAAAMAEVLDCHLKWPNDLQDSDGRKLGGILSELYVHEVDGPQQWWVILGVGLNVNQRDFPGLPDATSLYRLRGHSIRRSELLQKLIHALESADPAAPNALERWKRRNNTLGRRVRIGQVEGLAEDLAEDGSLIVAGQRILAGDVELISGS